MTNRRSNDVVADLDDGFEPVDMTFSELPVVQPLSLALAVSSAAETEREIVVFEVRSAR